MMAADRLLYFAYGSNLCLSRLRQRVPSCEVVGQASLAGYRLCFHKRGRDGSAKCDAFFTGNPDDRVLGVIYTMLPEERPVLDAAEDLGRGYDAHWVQVDAPEGAIEVLTYCTRPEAIAPDLQPFDWYLDFVLSGARMQGLDPAYLAKLGGVVSRPDPDRARAELNRKILLSSGLDQA